MVFSSHQGTSYGVTDRFSFRALRLAIEEAGLWKTPEAIGSFMTADLPHPYRITEQGALAAQSKLWLLAWSPNRISDGRVTGAWINLMLYRTHKAECPGTWGRWHWDGNIERPTLSPSIGSPGMNEGRGWHGFLEQGNWRPHN